MMLSKDEINRYEKQIRVNSIGYEGQQKLKQGRVLVIGAGGLGCACLQYLTAAGVGHLIIIDGDVVSESNLQRQTLYHTDDIGLPKAETIAAKLKKQNPFSEIRFLNEFLSVNKAIELIPQFDLIIDCSDNFGTRYLINDVCVAFQKAFISAALFQTEGQLGVFNLRLDNNFSANYRDVFPESDKSNSALDCHAAGVLATLPGLFGIMQANEAIKYFVSPSTCLINELLILNAVSMQQFRLKLTSATGVVVPLDRIQEYRYNLPCAKQDNTEMNETQISLVLNGNWAIIDVRDSNEEPSLKNSQIQNYPLQKVLSNHEGLKQHQNMLMVCRSGQRSRQAAGYLREVYPDKNIYSYKHGIEHLLEVLNHVK